MTPSGAHILAPMTKKIPVSAVLITYNADLHLRASLESLSICEDLVIVDSGSKDNTLQIAKEFNARVFHQDWIGFGPQKQFAVEQAQFNWVLCIDADEQLSEPLQRSIVRVFEQEPSANLAGFEMPRCNAFLGRYLKHGEGYPDFSKRLFHRLRAQWTDDEVHEKVLPTQGLPFKRLTGDLQHHSAENLESYLSKQNRYTSIQAAKMAEHNQWPSALKRVGSPLVRFIKFYFLRLGFLDGWQGFVHIAIGCFNSFMKYAKARAHIQEKKLP